MKRFVVWIGCVAWLGCSRASPRQDTSAALTVVAESATPTPPPAAEIGTNPFTFVAEAEEDRTTKLFALPSGVALFESTRKGWQVRVARGGGDLAVVDALRKMPESRRLQSGEFVGETGDGELWVSTMDEARFPMLEFVTYRVKAATVKRTVGKWYTALRTVAGGATIALPRTQTPAQLVDDEVRQQFEQVGGTGSAAPVIPPDLRLYDIEILPSGDVRAMAIRGVGDQISLAGWVAPAGAAARTLDLPAGIGRDQPMLVRGSKEFLASVGDKGVLYTERNGRLVPVTTPESFTSAAVGPDGDVWLAEYDSKRPRIRRIRIQSGGAVSVSTVVPFPSQDQLGVARAHGCRDLGFVETLVVLADGNAWVLVNCASGKGVLRAAARRPAR